MPAALGQGKSAPATPPPAAQQRDSIAPWEGLPVRSISYRGVSTDRLRPLPRRFEKQIGAPLDREFIEQSLHQLFATGLFETIEVTAAPEQGGVALVFRGQPRTFIGTVTVTGAKGATLNTQLLRASQLTAGARFTSGKVDQAIEQMRQTMAANGFHSPAIAHILTEHPREQLVDIAFQVISGPQARIGSVQVSGDPGMTVEQFRRHAHLKTGARVHHETANRALAGVLKVYQNEGRLEAEIKLESQKYDPKEKHTDFRFSANRGPLVQVRVTGASISPQRLKQVIPVFEEGTVDDDLLNEGNRRLRDYFQRMGYAEVKVEHRRQAASPAQVVIVYSVQLGPRTRVKSVSITGNHYFDSATLKDLISVHTADAIDRHGVYSQALLASDVGALQAVYNNNGFPWAKVTAETHNEAVKPGKTAPLAVIYHIDEGKQVRVGSVKIEGAAHADPARLLALLNTTPGQLLSPQNLAGDRDTLLTDYLSRGFDQATVDIAQQVEAADPDKVDVAFHITEGQQIFVRKVLLTGLHFTRPSTIARAITLHPGDPLNQTALAETQRNLYDFALFNKVDTAIENPTGKEIYKTVLLQTTEARRWALSYGFGFEVQTGAPQNNCGANCSPNGQTNISPRVLLDITRNNLFGREQSVSLRSNYGLLEQQVSLLFQNPHFEGNRDIGLTLTGGYANSRDVTTYVASRLEGAMRWSQNFTTPSLGLSRANTFIYEFDFRRVKVAAASLQVYPAAIQQLSTAVRVAGPSITWVRDTRDSPLDAHRGTYTSLQEFLSLDHMGAQAEFNRVDVSNSSFYSFGRDRFVLARNTRYGQERAFGPANSELLPLPERLYAGGATSLRSFPINAAGPRDPQTGFPIGGAGTLVNSTELRLPPPTLPWFGNTLSFVLFHDMGNVFANAGDIWSSAIRIHQPSRDSCTSALTDPQNNLDGPTVSIGQLGKCSFNYFTHAAGLGLRYHTPVGPIRLDFSYDLNPPVYPVLGNNGGLFPNPADYYMGQASHFNFFFSLGQAF